MKKAESPMLTDRLRRPFVVRLQTDVDGLTKLDLCQTVNISASGMLIGLPNPHAVGSKVEFEIYIPGQWVFKGAGRIIRHTTPEIEQVRGVGVLFGEFAGDGRRRLFQYLVAELQKEN